MNEPHSRFVSIKS